MQILLVNKTLPLKTADQTENRPTASIKKHTKYNTLKKIYIYIYYSCVDVSKHSQIQKTHFHDRVSAI